MGRNGFVFEPDTVGGRFIASVAEKDAASALSRRANQLPIYFFLHPTENGVDQIRLWVLAQVSGDKIARIGGATFAGQVQPGGNAEVGRVTEVTGCIAFNHVKNRRAIF